MKMRVLFLAPFVLAAAWAGVDESLVHARRAQALLGPDVWSQIIRVENTARLSAYPRTLHALVFELAGILWFYSDVDGTQSLSLHRGRLVEEKADIAPLLRDIEPGFKRWALVEVDMAATGAVAPEAPLPNGCFIESYAALRVRVARGVPISDPRLLSYYFGGALTKRQGHTVLTYSILGRVVVVDPLQPDQELVVSESAATDPVKLARAVQGRAVARARMIPLDLPAGAFSREVLAVNVAGVAELPGEPVPAVPRFKEML